MSAKAKSPSFSKSSKVSSPSVKSIECIADSYNKEEWFTTPEFIYGGPFIQPEKVDGLLNTGTPRNCTLQGVFKKSYAYYSLKERLPVILTKIIDYLTRERSKVKSANNASDEDIRSLIQYITKLKNELVTNKNYEKLTVDTDNAKKWNTWIENLEQKSYFLNTWVFTECYVYRRIREGCELTKGLQNFDPFAEQKEQSFTSALEPMCLVADKLISMLGPSEKDKRKADFQSLLKLCLWSNKCDLSLSAGEQVALEGSTGDNGAGVDPWQMIINLKDKLLIDDTAKIADTVVNKAQALAKKIEDPPSDSPPAPEAKEGAEPEGPPPPPVPCPAKMVIPQFLMFDIICDNAGYELFTDLCLAHFLISQNIVKKIRFHVKNMPWFVSDVTKKDFHFVIDSCKNARYNRTAQSKPEGDEPPESTTITSDKLNEIAAWWAKYVENGTFELLAEEFWTYPHVYKDMKTVDYNQYRALQLGVACLFKGDLNYRKLLGEVNCNPYMGFDPALQGFNPAPVIAIRTVKAELICGLPKGMYEKVSAIDEKWMEKGDYGVIQFSAKAEALKVSDRPCVDYGKDCFGASCPIHTDL